MKSLFSFILLLTVSAQVQAFELSDKLKMFTPYLGTWEAVFEEKDGVPTVVDVSHWQAALNGKALKTIHSINDGAYGGESIIFWDKKQQKLVFYYFTTADFYTSGEMEIINDKQFVAYEDVSVESEMSKGITKVRSTSTLSENELKVETSYLKNGQWTPPESRVYRRSDKTVKFK